MTAFVDLLGSGKALESLERLGRENLSYNQATELVQASVGRIHEMRNLIEGNLRLLRDKDRSLLIPNQLKDAWEESMRGETRICWFSDCGSINVIVDRSQILGTLYDVATLFLSLSYSTLDLAAVGQLIRGGVDMGVAVHGGTEEVLGSGLVHSYRLESKVADFPRICVGQRLLGFLSACDALALDPGSQIDEHRRSAILFASRITRDIVIMDPDGVLRIDFCFAKNPAVPREETVQLWEAALRGIESALNEIDPAKQTAAHRKHLWFRHTLHRALEGLGQGDSSPTSM